MPGDPYTRLLGTMRRTGGDAAKKGAVNFRLGTVLTPSPLTVDVAGTEQDASHFYVADRLQKGHEETVSLSGYTDSGGTIEVTKGTLAAKEPVLKAGDLVALLTSDDQTFIILDKVVHL
jgi:hypothetical protein